MGYSKVVFKGISWMGALQFAIRGLAFIKLLVMVKFLSPYQIGLFGIATLAVGFLETISDFGIGTFLIQHKDAIDTFVDTAWVMTIMRGLAVTITLVLISYPTAIFFKQQSALPLLLWASLIPAVKGFLNPSVAKFQKDLTFHKEFFYRTAAPAIDALVAIFLLPFIRNPLVLIFSLLLSVIGDTSLSFFVAKPLPRLHFNSLVAKEIRSFSQWVIVNSIVSYISSQLDTIVVGRILGTASLGIYQTIQKFSFRLLSDIGDIISKVTFPVFAKLRHDKNRAKQALKKILLIVVASLGAIALFMIVFAYQLLSILGSTWTVATTSFRSFAILGVIASVMAIITAFFLGYGRLDMTTKLVTVRTITLAIIILPLTKYAGISGAAFASLVSFIAIYPIAFVFLKKLIQ